jgi:uncharacterized protein YndB with AHSA1/START domain
MYSASIEIPATPSKVFAVLTDARLLKQWTPEVVEVRPPEGGLRVGAIGHALVEEFGRRFSAELVVAALEPDVKLAYDMTTPMWSGHIEYVLTHRSPGPIYLCSSSRTHRRGYLASSHARWRC